MFILKGVTIVIQQCRYRFILGRWTNQTSRTVFENWKGCLNTLFFYGGHQILKESIKKLGTADLNLGSL